MSSPRWFLAALLCCLSTHLVSGQGLQFTEVAAASGINWMQIDGGFKMGAGGAFLDYDGDGDLDVVCAGGTGSMGLFRNEGGGLFSDQSAGAGFVFPPTTFEIMGVCVGDYDGDLDPDIYVCAMGDNLLFRNDGNGSFSEVAQAAGVADARWSTTAAFADYDGDGDADLFVGNYIVTPSFPYHTPADNALFRNEGNGSFSDQTAATGVAGSGTALASLWIDDDDDGRLDLWVGNDFGRWITPNRLWRNLGPMGGSGIAFTDVAPASGADIAIYCMGFTAGDYDRDGDYDVYMSNLGPNVLLRNDGASGFVDVASGTGTSYADDPTAPGLLATSWGVGFHDFDHDGWIDLYVSNGHIPAASFIVNGTNTPSALFHHQGASLQFNEVAAVAGVSDTGIGRGCSFGDYDDDGDVDILQFNVEGSPSLFRNDTPNQGKWLELQARGRLGHPDAQGTRIRAHLPGGPTLLRDVNANYSFEASSSPRVHFGLGTANRVDLEVRWPSGLQSRLHGLPANARYPLIEPLFTALPNLSSAPTTISDGSLLSIDFALKNHGPSADAKVFFTVSAPGIPPVTSPLRSIPVGAGQSTTTSWQFAIPDGILPAGTSLPVTVVWTVFDPGLGFDQWRTVVNVVP